MDLSCIGPFKQLVAIVALASVTRAPTDGSISTFGTFDSPDGTKKVVVTRREVSLVDYEVIDSKTGRRIVSDYVGSDAMNWFLWWETPNRLWGYGSDIGYFKCYQFDAAGNKTDYLIYDGMTLPVYVWENLPSSMQKRFRAESKADKASKAR